MNFFFYQSIETKETERYTKRCNKKERKKREEPETYEKIHEEAEINGGMWEIDTHRPKKKEKR